MADRIRKINTSTNNVNLVIQSGLPAGAVIHGLDVSSGGGLFAADFFNNVVYKIHSDGRLNGAIAGHIGASGDVEASTVRSVDGNALSGQNARFSSPFGICVDNSGNIWLCDQANIKIKRLSTSGRVKNFVGAGTAGDVVSTLPFVGSSGNSGANVKFSTTLGGIGVDLAGVMYVADTGNHKIKKIWPNGQTQTLAGGPGGAGSTGFVNGQGNTARFASPQDCCVDRHGVVYVADTGNNRIRKIDENGNVTTLAGAAATGLTDGNGNAARFNSPRRICMDPSGQFVWVMDGPANAAIRRVAVSGQTTTFMHYNPPGSFHGDITMDRSGFLYIAENNS